LQSGIRAIVAPSFGETFYWKAINNQLLLAPVLQASIDSLLANELIASSRG
jgi:3-isopropylmalate/(R)-2-methylmalate dehydratase small subunit